MLILFIQTLLLIPIASYIHVQTTSWRNVVPLEPNLIFFLCGQWLTMCDQPVPQKTIDDEVSRCEPIKSSNEQVSIGNGTTAGNCCIANAVIVVDL